MRRILIGISLIFMIVVFVFVRKSDDVLNISLITLGENCDFNIANPPPLLMGITSIPPYSGICYYVNEYKPFDFMLGDFSLNNRVTAYDLYWFNSVRAGSNVPYRSGVRNMTGDLIPIAGWMCDLDIDGDVDNDDLALFLPLVQEDFILGDVDRDGDVDNDDLLFIRGCMDKYPTLNTPCWAADLDENLCITDEDILLVQQILGQK